MKRYLIALLTLILSTSTAAGFLCAESDSLKERTRLIEADEFITGPAGIHFKNGDYEKALTEIEILLEKYPGDTLIQRYHGITLDRLGRTEEAMQVLAPIITEESEPMTTRDVWVDNVFTSGSGPFVGMLPPTHGEKGESDTGICMADQSLL